MPAFYETIQWNKPRLKGLLCQVNRYFCSLQVRKSLRLGFPIKKKPNVIKETLLLASFCLSTFYHMELNFGDHLMLLYRSITLWHLDPVYPKDLRVLTTPRSNFIKKESFPTKVCCCSEREKGTTKVFCFDLEGWSMQKRAPTKEVLTLAELDLQISTLGSQMYQPIGLKKGLDSLCQGSTFLLNLHQQF